MKPMHVLVVRVRAEQERDTAMSRSRPIAAAALVLGLSSCGSSSQPEPQRAASPPTRAAAQPTVSPPIEGATLPDIGEPAPIVAGTYRMPRDPWAGSRYTFTIPRGWAVQYSHVFNKRADTPQEFGFYAVRVDEIFANACGPSPARPVGPGVSALVTALRRQPGPVVSDPAETTLGGRRAVRLDLTTPKRPQGCPNIEDGGIGLRIWYSKTADKNLLMTFDGMTSVYILEIPAGRQVFVASTRGGTTDAQKAELRRVLHSIRIPG